MKSLTRDLLGRLNCGGGVSALGVKKLMKLLSKQWGVLIKNFGEFHANFSLTKASRN